MRRASMRRASMRRASMRRASMRRAPMPADRTPARSACPAAATMASRAPPTRATPRPAAPTAGTMAPATTGTPARSTRAAPRAAPTPQPPGPRAMTGVLQWPRHLRRGRRVLGPRGQPLRRGHLPRGLGRLRYAVHRAGGLPRGQLRRVVVVQLHGRVRRDVHPHPYGADLELRRRRALRVRRWNPERRRRLRTRHRRDRVRQQLLRRLELRRLQLDLRRVGDREPQLLGRRLHGGLVRGGAAERDP